MLLAVRDHDRVAVRAGQKVSKTTSMAAIALWWAVTRPRARFILTAASARQVRRGFWLEVQRLHREAKFPLGGDLHDDPESGLRWPDGREILGISSDVPDKFLGLSSPNLFLAADEASAVPDAILETLDGNLAGGGKFMMAGNPTRNHGYFHAAFHGKRAFWEPIRIASSDSPNVTGERHIAGLATPEFIKTRREEWGETSWAYQVKILGEFAAQGESAFIPLSLVDAATERWISTPYDDDSSPLLVGVDPARFGRDVTACVAVRGQWSSHPFVIDKKDNVEAASLAHDFARKYLRAGEVPIFKVDQSNNNGVGDVLRRHEGVEVVDVNASETSPDKGAVRVRDAAWVRLKGWLEAGGAIPDDPVLIADLTAPTFEHDIRERIQIEPKKKLRERLEGRSTDRADALALAIWMAQRAEARDYAMDRRIITAPSPRRRH